MDFKGSQFERDIILWGVRWYVAYPISYRQLEEMMQDISADIGVATGEAERAALLDVHAQISAELSRLPAL